MKLLDVIDVAPEVLPEVTSLPPVKADGPRIQARRKLPADQRLTARQMTFVEAFIANGGNRIAAAIAAGVRQTSANVTSWKWLRHPLVTEEITRRTIALVAAAAPASVQKLMSLRDHATSQFVQLEASKDLLNRAGIGEHKSDVGQVMVVNIKL